MFLLLFSFIIISVSSQQLFNVTTSYGRITGKQLTSYENQIGIVFLGIPFAAPPTGSLRYKSPVDPLSWNSTLEAFQYKPGCLQVSQPLRPDDGPSSEDCLYLNVFSSLTCLTKKDCPVMVFIHGGGMMQGASSKFHVESFVNNFANEERNLVVVSVQYRLGVLGWLNLNPDIKHSVDSNLPIRDILFALNWIQKEISGFGGNKSHVTVMGQSAGGEFIQMIHTTGQNSGLFHQMIIMSSPFYDENRAYSRRFAQKLGCAAEGESFENVDSLETILSCVRSKSEQDILSAQSSFKDEVEVFEGAWVDNSDGVYPTSITDGLTKNLPSIPCIIGTTSGEFSDTIQLVDPKTRKVDLGLLDEICTSVGYERNYERPEEFRKICNEYYNNATRAVKFNDDSDFYHSTGVFANHFSRFGPTFVYSFEYKGSPGKHLKVRPAPGHSNDLGYLIGRYHFGNFSEKDHHAEKIHSGLFASFIKTGVPSFNGTHWENWTPERRNYMKIDFDDNGNLHGMRDGYYSEIHDLMDVKILKAAGHRRPLPSYPKKMDAYLQPALVNTLLRATSPAARERKALWEAHVKELKSLFSNPLSGSGWFIIIIGSFLLIIVLYVSFKAYYEWKTRRGYDPILEE